MPQLFLLPCSFHNIQLTYFDLYKSIGEIHIQISCLQKKSISLD